MKQIKIPPILKIQSLCMLVFLMLFSCLNAQEALKTPPALKKGDTIIIVAPAGILKYRELAIKKAKKLAESWGLKVILGQHLFNQNNHFSGTDEERTADFQKALDNPNIKAIWAARGGYGSVRILDKLNFTKFVDNPKWIIGYSDITAFHNHIHNLGVATIHGMMPTSLEQKPTEIIESILSYKKALFGEKLRYSIPCSTYNRINSSLKSPQKIEGRLIGGNLAILTSMLGSKSQLSTDGKILFIEEIGEYKYSIDRMLQSLKRAGYFKNVKAVIIGNMSSIKRNTTKWGSAVEQLILDVIPKEIPVLFDFPAGHEADNRALIFGKKVKLTVDSKQYFVSFY
jgi:muramoyltetrapeptide carboxypeptidase